MPLNSEIANLMLEVGRAKAAGALGSGQAWGNALSNIGQNIGGTIADIPRQQELAKASGDRQRARDAQQALAEAMKSENVGPVEQDGLKLYNVPEIGKFMAAKGFGDAFLPAAQHLDAVNQSMIGFQQARMGVVQAGAKGLLAAGAPMPLVNNFLDQLEKNQVYDKSTVQTYRDHLSQHPEDAVTILKTIAGPQKPVVLHEGDQGFDATTNAPIPGMAVAPKPVAPNAAALATAANDPAKTPEQRAAAKAALDALQAPEVAGHTTAAAQAAETARHNAAMEAIGRLTQGREAAAQAETARHNRATEAAANPLAGMTGGGGAASGPNGQPANPTGDDVLKNLSAPIAQQVKALAEGRMAFPGGFALKSPYWQTMIGLVSQYDPSFDATNYNNRASTRKDFSSGKSAQTVNALNTVAQHLDRLSTSADALNNSSLPAYNSIANLISKATGNPQVTKFETDKKAVVDELTKAWRQSGGTEADIKSWSSVLDAASSPAQLHTAIGEMSNLLEGKLSAMQTQLQQGMGKATDLRTITPEAQAVLDKLKTKADSTTPPASTTPKTLTIDQVKKMADLAGTSYDEAKKHAESKGYIVR